MVISLYMVAYFYSRVKIKKNTQSSSVTRNDTNNYFPKPELIAKELNFEN